MELESKVTISGFVDSVGDKESILSAYGESDVDCKTNSDYEQTILRVPSFGSGIIRQSDKILNFIIL